MANTKPVGVAYSDPELTSGNTNDGGTFTGVLGCAMGTSASPLSKTSAANFTSKYGTTSHTSGDSRLNYEKLTFTSTGSGETLRAFSVVTGAGAAAAGTINGAHISLSINGSGTISGAANALRATLGGSSTAPGGTISAIQVDSDFATGGSWTGATFLRFTNSGTGSVSALMRIPNASNGTIFAAHTTQTMTHSIKILSEDGTAYYVMCTNAATNRS